MIRKYFLYFSLNFVGFILVDWISAQTLSSQMIFRNFLSALVLTIAIALFSYLSEKKEKRSDNQ